MSHHHQTARSRRQCPCPSSQRKDAKTRRRKEGEEKSKTPGEEVNIRIGDDGTTVRINGGDVSGNYRFSFATEADALNFEEFLETVQDAGFLDELLG